MKTLKVFGGLFLVLILLVSFSSAITGSIGNARMILRLEPGETIEKSILVKNVNNVSVGIEIFSTGDLEESVVIIDNNFSLGPGEEKKAYFTITADKQGTTETYMNVKFTPFEGKNGVGLMSTIVVISGDAEDGEDEGSGWSLFGRNDETGDDKETNSSFFEIFQGNSESGGIGTLVLVLLLIVVVLILIYVLVRVMKTKPKKEVHEK